MGTFKMRNKLILIALIVSLSINIPLIIFAYHIIDREDLIDQWMLRFGLKSPSIDRTHEPGYFRMKSQYEVLPRIDSSIVFVGDSLTQGGNWAEMFQNPRIRNRGIGNESAEGILGRIEEILSPPPKKIFFQIGLSDMGRYYPVDEIFGYYEKIIDTCRSRAPEAVLYIQSVMPMDRKLAPPGPEDILRFNQRLKVFAEQKNCVYIDLYPLFADKHGNLDASFTNDGVHLNGKAYMLWEKAIEQYVN
jgi:lysophospholipase L1-like esterase